MRQNNFFIIFFLSSVISFSSLTESHAAGFFSGYAGIKTDLGLSDASGSTFDPQLLLQSFFAGQFNLTNDLIARIEFSLNTDDLIENSVFKKTPADFQIDEISLIYRKQFSGLTNYLSGFMGTYEPIGSDIFLRRRFGIQPISSKITESWLGLSGSVLYPLFGIGLSDVIQSTTQPLAAGFYCYINHENSDNYVFNSDLRYACVYPYIYLDLAGGIGAPMKTDYNGEKVIMLIDTLYAHGGMDLLIGNNFTPFSFYTQAGIYDIPIERDMTSFTVDPDKVYLLFEPRFKMSTFLLRFTLFSLPADTVEKLLFINDTLGLNLLSYTDSLYIGSTKIAFGINTTFSVPDESFLLFFHPDEFSLDTLNIALSPYISVQMFSGELHIMEKMQLTDLAEGSYATAFKLHIGYRTQL
ncbi:MAG: hypothetical protein M0P01_05380 [Treponema sp.]|nr:hypothetical protein [Treponema sp.]